MILGFYLNNLSVPAVGCDSNSSAFALLSVCFSSVQTVLDNVSDEVVSNIILHAFLNQASRNEDTEAALLDLLSRFPDYLSGLAVVLRYEMATAKGDAEVAQESKDIIAASHPGLIWRLEEIDEGQGLIAGSKVLRERYDDQ